MRFKCQGCEALGLHLCGLLQQTAHSSDNNLHITHIKAVQHIMHVFPLDGKDKIPWGNLARTHLGVSGILDLCNRSVRRSVGAGGFGVRIEVNSTMFCQTGCSRIDDDAPRCAVGALRLSFWADRESSLQKCAQAVS